MSTLKVKKTIVKRTRKSKKAVNMGPLACFPALVHETQAPHSLVLGTMPSVQSFEKGEYFAHGQNSFWKIAGHAFGFQKQDAYQLRKAIFTARGYALWDVLHQCIRPGSLDKDVTEDVGNDIKGMVAKYPTIERIIINSKKSATFFLKHNKNWLLTEGVFHCGNDFAREVFGKVVKTSRKTGIELLVMHSTSPAHTTSYDEKLQQWVDECYRPHM